MSYARHSRFSLCLSGFLGFRPCGPRCGDFHNVFHTIRSCEKAGFQPRPWELSRIAKGARRRSRTEEARRART